MRRRPSGALLAAIGACLVVITVWQWGPSLGYSVRPAVVVPRVGIAFVALGLATYVLEKISVRKAWWISTLTLGIVFVLGVLFLYYERAMTPPESRAPRGTARLIATQLELAFGLAPVPAGYVAGVYAREDRPFVGFGVLLGTIVAGWWFARTSALGRGMPPGFTDVIWLSVAIVAGTIALVPMLILVYLPAENRRAATARG